MTKEQLEHIIRAAAEITGRREFVIIGSQAILASYSDPGPELLASFEADIFALNDPSVAEEIDGAIGENSAFYLTFGIYAHGVGPETATLPPGWQDRLVRLATPGTRGAVGLCLEPHDIAVSKLVAGRDKDRAYVAALLAGGLVERAVLLERLSLIAEPERSFAIECLKRIG